MIQNEGAQIENGSFLSSISESQEGDVSNQNSIQDYVENVPHPLSSSQDSVESEQLLQS